MLRFVTFSMHRNTRAAGWPEPTTPETGGVLHSLALIPIVLAQPVVQRACLEGAATWRVSREGTVQKMGRARQLHIPQEPQQGQHVSLGTCATASITYICLHTPLAAEELGGTFCVSPAHYSTSQNLHRQLLHQHGCATHFSVC